jgi:hypothetical protein
MRGGCRCNNFQVLWHTVDFSVVPRACQCDYCRAKGAAYVSKSGTAVEVRIHAKNLHKVVTQGSRSAEFHECEGCGDVILVTATIDGETFGALNAQCMDNAFGFSAAIETKFAEQSAVQKQERWRQNWCCPVRIT